MSSTRVANSLFVNMRFPSCFLPLCQNKSCCNEFPYENELISVNTERAGETHFQKNSFAQRLGKQQGNGLTKKSN